MTEAVTHHTDPNLAALRRTAIDPAQGEWLTAVAHAVPARLDAVVPEWRRCADPLVVQAATFGLAMGALARAYPTTQQTLREVAEHHPCYDTIPDGRRLEVLERLSADPALVMTWLAPLLPDLDRSRAAHLAG